MQLIKDLFDFAFGCAVGVGALALLAFLFRALI